MSEPVDLSGLDALDEMFYGPGGKKSQMDLSNPGEATREQVEAAIVEWRGVREQRLAAEKVAAKIQETETALKSFVLEAFKQQKFEGMLIGGRTTGLTTKSVPIVGNKEVLVRHILDSKELDLLEFRLSTKAVKERQEAGKEVPGTEFIDVYDLFDRKV